MSRRFQGGESSEILGQNTVKNEDMFQCRHEVGTVNDSDKAVPLSVIQSCPVATCETAGGTAAKVGIVNNFSDFTLLNGREVLVYFASGNTVDNPTFNLNNTGAFPLALENQLSTVSIGSGCWGDGVFLHLKYVDVTVSNTRIQKWIICGHRIASQSSTQTTYADGQGRTNTVASGNMQSVTSDAVASVANTKAAFVEFRVEGTQTLTLPTGDISNSKNLLVVGWQVATGQIIDVLSYYEDTLFSVVHLGTAQTLSYTVTEAGYIDVTNTIENTWKVFSGRVLVM